MWSLRNLSLCQAIPDVTSLGESEAKNKGGRERPPFEGNRGAGISVAGKFAFQISAWHFLLGGIGKFPLHRTTSPSENCFCEPGCVCPLKAIHACVLKEPAVGRAWKNRVQNHRFAPCKEVEDNTAIPKLELVSVALSEHRNPAGQERRSRVGSPSGQAPGPELALFCTLWLFGVFHFAQRGRSSLPCAGADFCPLLVLRCCFGHLGAGEPGAPGCPWTLEPSAPRSGGLQDHFAALTDQSLCWGDPEMFPEPKHAAVSGCARGLWF